MGCARGKEFPRMWYAMGWARGREFSGIGMPGCARGREFLRIWYAIGVGHGVGNSLESGMPWGGPGVGNSLELVCQGCARGRGIP